MSKKVSMEEIRQLSKRSHKLLYGSDTDDSNNDNLSLVETIRPNKEFTQHGHNYELSINRPLNKRFDNCLKIIRSQLAYKHPFLFRNESALMSNIKGGTVLLNAEKDALKYNLIKKHQLARNKTSICLWEILDKRYEQIGVKKQRFKSKGGYLHRFCAQRIKETYSNRGYKVNIEYQHTNGKLIDLMLQTDSETIFVEICASRPLSKELINLEKDLATAPFPTKLIFAVTEHKMKNDLDKLLTQKKSICPVVVKLAGDMIDLLEII